MHLKRIVRYMTGVPSAKCLIEIVAFPQSADSHWAGQLHNLQQHERWSCTVEVCNEGGMVTNETVGMLELCRRRRTVRIDEEIREGMVTKHFMSEVGYSVTLL